MSGERRKWRESEGMEDNLQEGVTCGIKKKIGLDVMSLNHNVEVILSDTVASPTNRALDDQ